MYRHTALAAMVLWAVVLCGQDAGLTEAFSKLSGKERTRIAKEEMENAVNDQRYQIVMSEAEDHFRNERYDDALERYQVARGMRPYNVYPKVKIQDLQALISRRDAELEAAGTEVIQPLHRPAEVGLSVEDAPLDQIKEQRAMDIPGPPKTAPNADLQRPTPLVRERRSEPLVEDPKPPVHDGVTERLMREGRAIVLERVVVSGGRTTVWRKVDHPWGERVHFKDGIVVSALTWEDAFGDH